MVIGVGKTRRSFVLASPVLLARRPLGVPFFRRANPSRATLGVLERIVIFVRSGWTGNGAQDDRQYRIASMVTSRSNL